MARDQSQRPLTNDEIEALREEMRDQRGELRDYLASQGVDIDVDEDDSHE